jgi:hypothetical protein
LGFSCSVPSRLLEKWQSFSLSLDLSQLIQLDSSTLLGALLWDGSK